MSSAVSNLGIPYDAVNSGLNLIEEEEIIPNIEDFGPEFKRALAKSPMFCRLWEGGSKNLRLSIRKQLDFDEKGRLLYNGRLYNKDTWCCYFSGDCMMYGPPKVIRLQGRAAKEQLNKANTHPEITIITAHGEVIILDACPCGGELIMDTDDSLYCKDCGDVYSNS